MSNTAVTRRRLLSAGLAAAMAASVGCLGNRETENDASGRSLRLDLSHLEGPLRDRYVVDLSDTRPSWDEEAFNTSFEGGTYTTQGRKPFFSTSAGPEYVNREGTYYRLGSVIVDEVAATHPVLRLGETGDSGGDSSGDGIAADQLPDVDRRAVRIAHMAARARGNDGGVPWGLVDRGGYVYRQEAAVAASRLLADGGPNYVVYRETRYTVNVTREQFHEPIYRATIDPVAASPEQMERILRATFVDARIARNALSRAARDVLAAARGDGYGETRPYSPGYREVVTALHERAYLDGNIENDGIGDDRRTSKLLYDGDYFDYYLRFSPA